MVAVRTGTIVVVADDLSGAAEIAGIASGLGLKSEVRTGISIEVGASGEAPDLIALDTDSRTRTPDETRWMHHTLGESLKTAQEKGGVSWVFKKTDSVLRGHVAIECQALATGLGRSRILLAPANPSKGRVIRGGRYLIGGTPLERTAFAKDPEYPREVSGIRELLGADPEGEGIRIDTPNVSDLDSFEGLLERLAIPEIAAMTLPAGAADWFTALVVAWERERLGSRRDLLSEAAPGVPFWVCGSLGAWFQGRERQAEDLGFEVLTLGGPGHEAPDGGRDEHVLSEGRRCLEEGRPLMVATGHGCSDSPSHLLRRLGDIATQLIRGTAPRDLRVYVEGGATARALLERLGHHHLSVPPLDLTGVGCLQVDPIAAGGQPRRLAFLVKPGSYPWPDEAFANLS